MTIAIRACGLRSLSWNWFLAACVALIAVLLFAVPAHAAGKPLSISFYPLTQRVTEGQSATLTIAKSGGNGRVSAVAVKTSDGSFAASELPGVPFAIPTVDDTLVNGDRTVGVTGTASTGATALATFVIVDNDVAPPPPAPPPSGDLPLIPEPLGSMPTRACPSGQVILDLAGFVCNPRPPVPPLTMHGITFMGEAEIPDNFDLNATSAVTWSDPANPTTGLWYGGVPAHSDEGGNFRFACLPGQVANVDPLVSPGQRSMHLHQFFGNTQVTENSTSQSLRTTGRSTCSNPLNDPANRSAYWLPAMLDGVGDAVKPDLAQIYYKQHPASDPACAESGQCIGVPTALRYTWGYPYMDPTAVADPANSMNRFECWRDLSGSTAAPGVPGIFHTIDDTVSAGCGSGALLIINFVAPDCWNGVVDAPDHRSNMAYPTRATVNGFRCPLDHPYWTPNLSGYIAYTTDANFLAHKWHFSSDDMLAAMLGHAVPAGSTLHLDYWEAWSPVVKATWQFYCINLSLNCAGGDLGDGTAMNHDDLGPRPTHQLVSLGSIP